MDNMKVMIKNSIIFIVLFIITFLIIFHNYDFNRTINLIFHVNIIYVILGIILMLGYFTCESINVRSILSSLGKDITLIKSIKYTILGFFFCGITPAASGGQPMEIFFMKKDDIPVSLSALALLVQYCSFKVIMISFGIIGAILNYHLLDGGFIWAFVVGLILNTIAFVAMMIGLFAHKTSKKIIDFLLNILKKMKYSKYDKIEKSTYDMLSNYYEGSKFIKSNKSIFIKSLLIVLVQMLCYYSIPYCVYRSFGLNSYSHISFIFMQATLFITSSSIPLPGSIGISETSFLKIYSTIFGASLLASAMLLNRTINFYIFMLLGVIISLVASMKIKKRVINN